MPDGYGLHPLRWRWFVIVNSARIHASPARVWQMTGDPMLMPQWNPRVQSVSRMSLEGPCEGARYRITVRFGGREATADLEIVEYEPLHRIVTRTTGGRLAPGRFVTESWTLEELRPGVTLLRHRVDLRHSGIRLLWRVGMYVLHRVGRPVGTLSLDILAQLVERNADEPPTGAG